MDLEEWLNAQGREWLAALAQDMPSHGVKKPDLIAWILADADARDHALEAMEINEELDRNPKGGDAVGFVNYQGDAL